MFDGCGRDFQNVSDCYDDKRVDTAADFGFRGASGDWGNAGARRIYGDGGGRFGDGGEKDRRSHAGPIGDWTVY